MTLFELLQTPLMKNAVVEHGNANLDSDVTWCSPDIALRFDNWIIPGLLLVYTGELEEQEFKNVYKALQECNASGILVFDDKPFEDGCLYGKQLKCYDNQRIPVIHMPVYTNMLSFTKQLSVVLATNFENERYVENWLREICYSGNEVCDRNIVGERFGYHSQNKYICMILRLEKKRDEHSIGVEMNLKQAEGIVSNYVTQKNENVLSFLDGETVISFVPSPNNIRRSVVHEELKNVFEEIKKVISGRIWSAVVGSLVKNLDDFRKSYLDAIQTENVVYELKNQIQFYDDWYAHIFILKRSEEELEQLVDQVLDPLFEHQDLLQLLAVYYTYGEDLKATAERLFIHVNTVKYRLKKVDEILGYNSRESNARFRLQLAIIAYQHLQQNECKV